MIDNPFTMVVLIVAIVMIASVYRAKYRGQGGSAGAESRAEADRLRHEVRALKERVAVLERLITDERGSRSLEHEIEALRSRDA